MPSPASPDARRPSSPPRSPPPPLGCKPSDVFLASTGVIGEPLDATKFGAVMDRLVASAAPGAWHEAAKAIMTTDTFPKGAAAIARLGSTPVTVCGIAKGAGMIAPDMATMLSFVFTDAPIAARVLQSLLAQGVTDTFNAVTIDGDTSTSDTLLAFATGAAAARGAPKIANVSDPRLPAFRKAFDAVLANLAEQVARDGEGARKLVEDHRRGRGVEDARRARSRCRSPIRRWSRPRSPARTPTGAASSWRSARPASAPTATGSRSGSAASASPTRASATRPTTRPQVSAAMKKPEITLKVALGLGRGRDRVLTCDLTKDYVAINGDYRS